MNAREMRRRRLERNLTLNEVAGGIGVDPSYISKLERGKARPSPLVQLQMERFLAESPAVYEVEVSVVGDAKPGRVDGRNGLNELSGTEWIQETKTVWRQKGLGANHEHTKFERLHPAPFSFQDVARLIRLFTKKGMLVLDPMCGVGSTLKAAALEGRRGLGIELSPQWAELAQRRLTEEVPDASGQTVWCIDVREAVEKIPDSSVDFIVTSPPYWSILNKRPDHKTKAVRLSNGLAQSYSIDKADLGNIEDYDAFLGELVRIFERLSAKLVPGKYFVVIVSDFKHGDRYYPFHSDLYGRLDPKLLSLQGVVVLTQDHKALYPYGYPYAYVPNIHHHYILILRRPPGKKDGRVRDVGPRANRRSTGGRACVPDDLSERLRALSALPYREGGMASRHWGHSRHSICSFPSKMKPAIASTLVELFSEATSVVMDPFCGSGTIPFEAALKGRRTLASDLAPLSFVITSGKVAPPNERDVAELLALLGKRIARDWRDAAIDGMEEEIRSFFHVRTAREIEVARKFLSGRSGGFRHGSAELFVAACLAHILHGNRPYALSRRSHNIIPIPPKGPRVYKPLLGSLNDKCERMLEVPLPRSFVPGTVFECGADSIPIEAASADVVITSPPFLGATDFLRQNRLRNWLVGWNYAKQEKMKTRFIEHQADLSSYKGVVKELGRLLRPRGIAVFHVGVVRDTNMADLLAPVFADGGFTELGRVWEDASHLETHGRTDRGGTHTHGFVLYQQG